MNRRNFLQAVAAAAAISSSQQGLCAITPPVRSSSDPRTIFAMSAISPKDGLRMLNEMLKLTKRTRPNLLIIPTAIGDDPKWIAWWRKLPPEVLNCDIDMLTTFGDSTNMTEFHRRIVNADAVFVMGGNTLSALAVWRAHGIDKSLRAAWEKGVVLGGESAGMICWFEQGLSDSRPEKLSVVDGLGFLPGSCCPHYEDKNDRRKTYQSMVGSGALAAGYGCESGTALVFSGTELREAITTDAALTVSRLTKAQGGADVKRIEARVI